MQPVMQPACKYHEIRAKRNQPGRFSFNERISKQLLLSKYNNGVGQQIQSLELTSELPVRLCAEWAVKMALRPLEGSDDPDKRDKDCQRVTGGISGIFWEFQGISRNSWGAPAPRMPADHQRAVCAHRTVLRRDDLEL